MHTKFCLKCRKPLICSVDVYVVMATPSHGYIGTVYLCPPCDSEILLLQDDPKVLYSNETYLLDKDKRIIHLKELIP